MNIYFEQLDLPFNEIFGPTTQYITHLAYDSRLVQKDGIFFSIKGENHDGHEYISDAVKKGAVTVVGTSSYQLKQLSKRFPHCTFLVVDNVRFFMAHFSKYFYGNSDDKLKTIGVTGTNGKTTVAAYVRSLLTLLHLPTGSIGTTGIWSSKQKLVYAKSTPTTPESTDLHHIFHDLLSLHDQAAVMEVSSIALDQQRVEGMTFDVAIHTNFSEEHLEYHKTMEHYKQSKMRLFQQAKSAVVNVEDEGMGDDLLQTFTGRMVTYSISEGVPAMLQARYLTTTSAGTAFDLHFKGNRYEVFAPVYGDYNIANVLSAIGTALLLGYHIENILDVLPNLESPEGRFQVIQGPNNQRVILDYAHTPVALTRLLHEVKKLPHNRLILMIAGIGIRDFNKMPKMARVAEGQADEIVVTVDHPGFHDPNIIVDNVIAGFSDPHHPNIHRAPTRREGVLTSLSLGEENDIILLTSGCINGAQLVKGEAIPHSDEAIIDAYYASVLLKG
ncbi:UDP-N-acetylmuramoyl-L-alanyl-D-glutamate--2,6-diaminopimelate ligase [Priestia koreensis]|uniref:UDP-N-acetylmuramyl-tripeptide synthetase n=1 Tax=Priestia koreensis TaxID=284581 RepID=A0A0M0KWL7_9BACI|nr:UDP-N-acetylmuramoyl-L-alanyl-D-glutamate--2,6-diaminopimelate ligase [Priestia koreensis]KOO42997.1 UDP-N-acetylmuramoylalanyl-D-glutamate--2,6-diaminopimelate ligase [Priestia koreensis]